MAEEPTHCALIWARESARYFGVRTYRRHDEVIRWTPLLGRFMLSVTWENVLEHVAGASDDPLGVKGSWVRIPPSRPGDKGQLSWPFLLDLTD
ncbi:hypothetical protein AB0H83_51780, partial [Dactylosporangium sp. NPDC050688]|uniref:hypothetical protein n=1 Tax=Dactylosporangium sp. NPDC050688 TaxID=3157217 RepID=UPI0033CE2F10